jgi:hypothetical protein
MVQDKYFIKEVLLQYNSGNVRALYALITHAHISGYVKHALGIAIYS